MKYNLYSSGFPKTVCILTCNTHRIFSMDKSWKVIFFFFWLDTFNVWHAQCRRSNLQRIQNEVFKRRNFDFKYMCHNDPFEIIFQNCKNHQKNLFALVNGLFNPVRCYIGGILIQKNVSNFWKVGVAEFDHTVDGWNAVALKKWTMNRRTIIFLIEVW